MDTPLSLGKSNSCGVKSVVFKRMAYMCIIVLEMDTFLLTAFFPFHTHFSSIEILCWKQQQENLHSNWLISDPSLSHFENTILDDIFFFAVTLRCPKTYEMRSLIWDVLCLNLNWKLLETSYDVKNDMNSMETSLIHVISLKITKLNRKTMTLRDIRNLTNLSLIHCSKRFWAVQSTFISTEFHIQSFIIYSYLEIR